jgi:hypothetical protein
MALKQTPSLSLKRTHHPQLYRTVPGASSHSCSTNLISNVSCKVCRPPRASGEAVIARETGGSEDSQPRGKTVQKRKKERRLPYAMVPGYGTTMLPLPHSPFLGGESPLASLHSSLAAHGPSHRHPGPASGWSHHVSGANALGVLAKTGTPRKTEPRGCGSWRFFLAHCANTTTQTPSPFPGLPLPLHGPVLCTIYRGYSAPSHHEMLAVLGGGVVLTSHLVVIVGNDDPHPHTTTTTTTTFLRLTHPYTAAPPFSPVLERVRTHLLHEVRVLKPPPPPFTNLPWLPVR